MFRKLVVPALKSFTAPSSTFILSPPNVSNSIPIPLVPEQNKSELL